ncbi:hypothetical protein QP794_23550 [Paenibacillus sp. UMB7766-LJ446]|uniref:hypothetical protein n=1 Tax=Paenibacillus sp. UMB7766-LJ446 TaxID=3046313 RepID=UPI00254F1798|nr:hypothetical protein [Paenibacillus sp. UMB7766-LJ446]MDK8193069.1 hypothetical protein [Paenibacillus sp. UMB7766-LJ446]
MFGSENNKDVLLAFLNRVLTEAGDPPLTEIILMNPYTDKDDPLDWEVLKMNEPRLEKKALNTLQFLSQDSEAHRLYEARQKYLHDEASMLEGARKAGITEVAKNMLDLNLDIPTIANATGLTEQEIIQLKR